MSTRYQAGIIRPGYNALKVPNAPTIGTATSASGTSVSVTVTAPSDVGGGAISSFTAFTSCGAYSGSNTTSPVTVTGLTTGTSYTFKAIATNAYGPSLPSAVSNSETPVAQSQEAFVSAGTYSWVAPTGVTSVSIVTVGAGGAGGSSPASTCNGYSGGGGGGGLGYKNNYSVTPGTSYTVVVGLGGRANISNGGDSYFVSTATVKGAGGTNGASRTTGSGVKAGGTGGSYTGDGGGSGGGGGSSNGGAYNGPGGGGGAGGYAGTGGQGGGTGSGGNAGSGGAGGGGFGGPSGGSYGAGAGGVGILGQGTSGGSSTFSSPTGRGGSGGSNAGGFGDGSGGAYGGGSAGGYFGETSGVNGAVGAVRIIWPGTTRSFPSTNTGDL